uniref:Transmembrane protein 65 n=1 Tax=Macrostomum lignano TaxID=282301 RepID=A0A1I8HPG2_9PLAT
LLSVMLASHLQKTKNVFIQSAILASNSCCHGNVAVPRHANQLNSRSISTSPVRCTVLKRPPKWASSYVRRLNAMERLELMAALRLDAEQHGTAVFTLSAIPFVGFGFFDNAIMIVAGEYIDLTLGAAFCISTLAAAALGNWVSDLAGLSLASWVEGMTSRLGFETPRLTPQQLELRSTRWATVFGRSLGISLGCLLGMLPLLFIDTDEADGEDHKGK